MNYLSFFLTSFIIIIIPGTGVIYTISQGLTNGYKASLYASFGCTFGIIPHLLISIFLTSSLLKLNTATFNIIKLIGAIYIFYLGIGMIHSKNTISIKSSTLKKCPVLIIKRAILINLLNPKLTLFFFSFLPQYISAKHENYIFQFTFLGIVFMLMTLLIFILYGILSSRAKKFIDQSPRFISSLQKLFGLIFVIFALRIIVP